MMHRKIGFWHGTLITILGGMALFIGVAGGYAKEMPGSPVLLISVDGMKPEYIWKSDELGLKIPNLRTMAKEGTQASRVRGVLPASTFPGHITLITGVSPAKHGVYHNRPFLGTERISGERWDWRSEHIQVPTLWNLAAASGLQVGVVGWPVSVGAKDIAFNIPERVVGSKDKEHWKVVTPGLMDAIGPGAAVRIREGKGFSAKSDWERTSYALELIEKKGPDLLAVHLAGLDSAQHSDGPFAPSALKTLEELDEMIGKLTKGFRARYPGAIVCVASDHGFSDVSRVLRIDAAFVREGLVTLNPQGKTYGSSKVEEWVAVRVPSGGSSPVFLKNPENDAARERVEKFLRELASDPENGIAAILDKKEIAEIGGNPDADFWIDLKPGFVASHHLGGGLTAPRGKGRDGTHGYSPTHEEMDSAFLISGNGIRRGATLGRIDMRNIAPTLAKALGTSMPTAEAPALDVFVDEARLPGR